MSGDAYETLREFVRATVQLEVRRATDGGPEDRFMQSLMRYFDQLEQEHDDLSRWIDELGDEVGQLRDEVRVLRSGKSPGPVFPSRAKSALPPEIGGAVEAPGRGRLQTAKRLHAHGRE